MPAANAAHAHEPPKWPAIERFVESERHRLGRPPTYVLRADANERRRNDVYNEICMRWRGYQVTRCGNEISVFGCD